MTNPGLASLDDACFAAFFGAGLADDAVFYREGDGLGIRCKVLLDRSLEYTDQATGAPAHGTVVTVRRSEIGIDDPPLQSFFIVGRETFTIDRLAESSDESRVVALVTVSCR